jgi:hypothetical protein
MDKKLKANWVAALRSRKFKQARRKMVIRKDGENRFCCLGVLERLCGTPIAKIKENNTSLWLTDMHGVNADQRQVLAHMNDGIADSGFKKHSFRQIADYIEKNL